MFKIEDFKKNPRGVLLWNFRKIHSMEWTFLSHHRNGIGKIVMTVPYRTNRPHPCLTAEEKRERLQCAAAWHLRDKFGGLDNSSIRIELTPFEGYISINITTTTEEEYNLFTPKEIGVK
jgi:hypothetical protein